MVVEIKTHICDGYALKWLFGAALDWLTHNQEHVNKLNVFPVPDGDTGKNMCLTLRKGYEAIQDLYEPHIGIVADKIANGTLLGARGNSGVILSQLIRGFADTLAAHEVMNADLLADASESAVDAAYRAVINPTEGTILTVARGVCNALVEYVETNKDLVDALRTMVEAANMTLAITPELLPVLKEAGVVDSGGQGLTYILEGMLRAVEGRPTDFGDSIHEFDSTHEPDWQVEADLRSDDAEGYGYDVQLLMVGKEMDVERIRRDIDALGWSTLVVGSADLIKVHVHVHDPGQPITYAIRNSDSIDDVVVENMQLQYERLYQKEADTPYINHVEGVAVITVASGKGLRDLFYNGLNAAYVISGGQTMNPSADDFLQAIQALENDEIVLMPNNKNIVMAAQQAARLADDKQVRVVPTTSIPQGISAMVGYLDLMDGGSLDAIVDAMHEFKDAVISGEITRATRNAQMDGVTVQEGQYIGLLNGKLVSGADDLETVARTLLAKAGADEHELVTLYYGDGLAQTQVQTLANSLKQAYGAQHFEVVDGGQPLYPLLIGIE